MKVAFHAPRRMILVGAIVGCGIARAALPASAATFSARETSRGLLIERAGLFLLTASGLVYTITLVASGGWRAVAAASFVLGFAGASAIRAFEIGRMLVRVKALALARRAVLEGDSKE